MAMEQTTQTEFSPIARFPNNVEFWRFFKIHRKLDLDVCDYVIIGLLSFCIFLFCFHLTCTPPTKTLRFCFEITTETFLEDLLLNDVSPSISSRQ